MRSKSSAGKKSAVHVIRCSGGEGEPSTCHLSSHHIPVRPKTRVTLTSLTGTLADSILTWFRKKGGGVEVFFSKGDWGTEWWAFVWSWAGMEVGRRYFRTFGCLPAALVAHLRGRTKRNGLCGLGCCANRFCGITADKRASRLDKIRFCVMAIYQIRLD